MPHGLAQITKRLNPVLRRVFSCANVWELTHTTEKNQMYKSVQFERLENPTGPTAWEIVRLGKPMPRRYDTLDEALSYARLCYDHPGDRDTVFVRQVRTDA